MVRLTAAFAHALCGILGVEPQPLRCVNVHDHRMVDAVHLLEGTNQLMHIVAVLHIAVVESEVAEQIAFAPAVRLTHCGQRRIHATMVLGNRHLVVVDENDHIAALLGGVVEPSNAIAELRAPSPITAITLFVCAVPPQPVPCHVPSPCRMPARSTCRCARARNGRARFPLGS